VSDPIWPSSLNQDVLRPMRRTPPAGAVIGSPVEKGPPKARPRYTAGAPWRLDVEVPLDSRAQVATFETFRDGTLAYGSLPFTWVDPLDGASVRMQIDPGRFDSVVVTQVGGNHFRAPLPLLVLEVL